MEKLWNNAKYSQKKRFFHILLVTEVSQVNKYQLACL